MNRFLGRTPVQDLEGGALCLETKLARFNNLLRDHNGHRSDGSGGGEVGGGSSALGEPVVPGDIGKSSLIQPSEKGMNMK